MAMAIANCTCETCGAKFNKVSYNRCGRRDADRWTEWAESYYNECPDCYKQRKREADQNELNELTAAYELPSLNGSEKQVSWAEKLRLEIVKDIVSREERLLSRLARLARLESASSDRKEKLSGDLSRLDDLKAFLLGKTEASWWIDHRGLLLSELEQRERQKAEEDAISKETVEQSTVRPDDCTKPGAVVITVTDQKIRLEYQKDDDFRSIVKAASYRWDSDSNSWNKRIPGWDNPGDRAAEIGSKLLNAGFSVSIQDAEIRRKAVQAEYLPEHTRVITVRTSDKYKGWFSINWSRGEDFYDTARSIPQSKYNSGAVVVPPTAFESVEDFAEHYDFLLTPGARDLVARERRKVTVVVPAAEKKPEFNEHDPRDIMTGSYDILDDLKDDD